MNIRSARLEDTDAIHQLGSTVDEFTVNNKTVSFWPKPLLAAAIEGDDAIVLVAEEAGIIYGFIITNCNRSLSKAIIENIYVVPDRRGEGVGQRLLSTLEKELLAHNYHYVATLVPPDDAAATLYQHAGFSHGEIFVWYDKPLQRDFKA